MVPAEPLTGSLYGASQLPISSAAPGPLKLPWKEEAPLTPAGAMKDPEKFVLPFEKTVSVNV